MIVIRDDERRIEEVPGGRCGDSAKLNMNETKDDISVMCDKNETHSICRMYEGHTFRYRAQPIPRVLISEGSTSTAASMTLSWRVPCVHTVPMIPSPSKAHSWSNRLTDFGRVASSTRVIDAGITVRRSAGDSGRSRKAIHFVRFFRHSMVIRSEFCEGIWLGTYGK